MAGKHKQKRQIKDQTINQSNTSSESNSNEPSTSNFVKRENCRKKSDKIRSRRISVIRSRSPVNSKSKKKPSKSKDSPKVEKPEILLNSSSIDSDTGSQISKRRRRETRNTSVEQVIESQSISSQPIETTKSRRRRSVLPQQEESKIISSDINMASSSSQRTNTNDSISQLSNDQSKNSLPSTSRGKRNNTSKNKSKFPQFNISSGRDSSIFLSSDNALQGIVSSGMDISHFQNYLSSRSLTTSEIGDQINKKLDEMHTAAGDRTQEYMLMSEINQHLLVSYEDSLNSLRVSELTGQVVTLIQNCEDNLVDLKNICYNVLLHLMEALPRSSDYLVSSLGMFLNKISNLFDFDSLEQIINVIERISRRHGQAVLQCGAFTIILNYYDFLTAPQQLTILNMISQCFTNLKASDFNYIIDGIENLTNRLKQSEPKCVEKVIQCFVRLVSAFQNDEVKLKKLASNNLFVNLQELLISSPPVISDIHEIIQMMAILCTNCSDLAVDLIKQNITQTILCVCNSMTSDSITVSNCNNRSVEEMLALVNLIAELMPTLPQNEDIFIINRVINANGAPRMAKNVSYTEHSWYWFNSSSKQWISHPQNVCQLLEKSLQSSEFEVTCQSNSVNIEVNLILMLQIHYANGTKIVSDLKRSRHQVKQPQKYCDVKVDSRRKLLLEQCSRFESSDLSDNVEAVELIRHLFPLLIDIYNEASSYQVRYKCLEAIIRMIYPTTNKTLNNVLNKASLSSLMASLLTSQDATIIINAIQMGIILKKLPPSLIFNFKKEGVLFQLDRMLCYWKEKTCEPVPNTHQSTSYFPNETNLAMTVSAPSGTLDQLSLENLNDMNDKSDAFIERFTDTTSANATTNTTQRFTNWIMKRSSCIGRPVTTDVPHIPKNRKQRAELDQALDMSIKPMSDSQNPTSKRINQIMSMLNLNTSLASLDSKPSFNEKINYENPNKENYCKQWIVKFGSQLISDWKEIGEESVNQKISSISCSNGPHQKKDVMYYLKEVVIGLRSENNAYIKKALNLYSELLSNDCYISVFEMESSGINEALLDFFTNSDNIDSKRDHFVTFLDIYMRDSDLKSADNKSNYAKKPFVSLVHHVLMCLHQQEQFHVRMFQFPSTQLNNLANSSSKLTMQSRFNLTQALTEAVLGRMSSHRRIDSTQRNLDSSIIEARILPNILLEPSFSRSTNKLTDIECHFAPYPYEKHASDALNGVEQWSGGEFIAFNNSFNVILDVLATVSNVEKIVMREIARHRRITKRFGIMTKESSINDSSDSDDDYDCDAINESLLSGEIDYQDDISDFADISFSANSNKKHKTISDKLSAFNLFHLNSAHTNTKATNNKKTRGKQANMSKSLTGSSSSTKSNSNTLSKFRENGLKALANRRSTRQSIHDSESHAVTPSTSSGCSSSLVTSTSQGTTSKSTDSHCSSKFLPESVIKPISKMQILIGDTILPTEMTLYQAIRRYSSHVTQFLSTHKGGKTDQELEEAINQVIWKSHHNIYYRPVCATNQPLYHSRQSFKSVNADSISTFNFMASLMNSASHSNKLSSHLINDQFRMGSTIPLSSSSHMNFVPSSSSVNTRQRTFHKKIISPQLVPTAPDTDQPNYAPALRHKRRRKNNLDTNISIGRHSNNCHKILFTNLTKKLPYPILIDYPTIFEPIPNNKNDRVNKFISSDDSDSNKPQQPYDLTFAMSQKLETTLALLRCLSAINRHWHVLSFNLNCNTLIPETEFRSPKLSSKANRQLQDTFSVLARNLPFWCIQLFHACAFLFSVETRQNFFYLFNFDRARTLLYLEGASNQDSDNFLDSTSSEVRRMRVQVNRSDRLLEESELLLKNQTDPRVILEISFNNEAGFGLGPTNEFYTQVSTCLMRSDLMLWYTSGESADEYVMPPPIGLYPRPIYNKNKKLDNKIRNKFVFLGRLMARALLDCRKLDIPLNPVFYKWILGQEECIHSADLYHIDPLLSNQLKSLHEIVEKKLVIDADKTLSPTLKKDAYDQLGVEDLLIVFVHPLYTQIELIKDGANRVVTVHDLSLYLDLVASVTLVEGVRAQMECVIEGFDSLLPGARMHLSALFEAHEIEEIFCGGRVEDNQSWDVKTLTEVCTCDHGYTMNSRSIINLFEIMSEFTKEQRRHFVQFCTGTPRLPVGGFRALRPPFKIVNKKEGGENPDNYLPSVMTCQNFLKLPDYSSKEVMRQRLLYALHEGQNAFFLS